MSLNIVNNNNLDESKLSLMPLYKRNTDGNLYHSTKVRYNNDDFVFLMDEIKLVNNPIGEFGVKLKFQVDPEQFNSVETYKLVNKLDNWADNKANLLEIPGLQNIQMNKNATEYGNVKKFSIKLNVANDQILTTVFENKNNVVNTVANPTMNYLKSNLVKGRKLRGFVHVENLWGIKNGTNYMRGTKLTFLQLEIISETKIPLHLKFKEYKFNGNNNQIQNINI